MELLYIILVTFLASMIQVTTGFGYGIVTMSLWPFVLPLKQAAVMEAVTCFFMVVGLVVKLRKHINYKLLTYPLISSFIFNFLGVYVLVSSTEALLRRILGLVLIATSVYFIFFSEKITLLPNRRNGFFAGALSGFFNGVFSLGGPPVAVYFLSVAKDKMEYNATMQCFFAVNVVLLFFNHLFLGNINTQVLQDSAIAIIGLPLGTLAGFVLFKKLSVQLIKKIVYVFMLVFGLHLTIAG
ncbi:sulfite exporter TauE/SafE family protein [Caproiciproducens faecalis]|uniref:Probable membrane transporter protein n=1 Tax=Caproiciproducens faecalis TaxID=2820301 RepID=A0ABS7DM32_9FIRM|nr:sulfite exporter TauE/SafE family protein [Caproiciproducens faecalis]MBW7572362.1 sulfite exporter TauE/SafE family protein [Caproiciproducens faecalis]